MEDFTSGRLSMWARTIAAVLKRPLFGYGEGQFPWAVEQTTGVFAQPHNIVLQLLLQWGIIGTFIALALATLLGSRINRALRHATPEDVPAFLIAATLLTMSLYDATLFHSYPTMMFVMSVAVILGSAEPPAKRDIYHIATVATVGRDDTNQ